MNAKLIKCQSENSNLKKEKKKNNNGKNDEQIFEIIESITEQSQEMKIELSKVSYSLLDEQKRFGDLQKQMLS